MFKTHIQNYCVSLSSIPIHLRRRFDNPSHDHSVRERRGKRGRGSSWGRRKPHGIWNWLLGRNKVQCLSFHIWTYVIMSAREASPPIILRLTRIHFPINKKNVDRVSNEDGLPFQMEIFQSFCITMTLNYSFYSGLMLHKIFIFQSICFV